ncbi:putative lipoprotein [Burkholderia sp. MSHR3999]|nr:putative lipoprotein [Burkholderia sp. MSHR3999]
MSRHVVSYSRLAALVMLLSTLSACGNDLNQDKASAAQGNAPFNIPVIARDESQKPRVSIDSVMVVSAEYDLGYWSNRHSEEKEPLLQGRKQRLQGVAIIGGLPARNDIQWGPSEHGNLDLWPSTPASTQRTDRFHVNWVSRETVGARTFYDNMTATLSVPVSLNQNAILFLHFLPGNRVAADWFSNASCSTPEAQWTSLAPRQEVPSRLGPQRVAMKLLNTSGRKVSRVQIEQAAAAGAEKSPSNQLPSAVFSAWWSAGFGEVAAGSPTAPAQAESPECSMGHRGGTCEFSVVSPDGKAGARLKMSWLEQQPSGTWNCQRSEVDVPPYSLKRQASSVWRMGDEIANTVWIRLLPDHRVSAEVHDSALAAANINASPVKAPRVARTVSVCGGKGEGSIAQCCEEK